MAQSEQINELAAALAAAQAEMDFASKDAENPGFKQGGKNSRYANLASVWEVVREVLPKNGLAVMQTFDDANDQSITCVTVLAHKSGQWINSRLRLPAVKNDPQAFGSAITYARRYALAAMVGVVADDDDGNAASAASKSTPQGPPPAKRDPMTSEQHAEIIAEASRLGLDADKLLAGVRTVVGDQTLEGVDQLFADEAAKVIKAMKARQ